MHQTLFVIEPPRILLQVAPFVVVGAVFVVLGFWVRKSQPGRATPLVVFGGLVALAGLLLSLPKQPRHEELYRAYVDGRCRVVEGLVHLEHLESRNDAGHGLGDLVQVGGEEFRVSHFEPGPGYTQSVVYGGVLREGARVRVWLYEGSVLRIDRASNTGGPAHLVPSGSATAAPPG